MTTSAHRRESRSGVLVIDKPPGVTSHDVVSRIRRLFGMKRVGHTGTLDPMATGVLVICLGQATRIAEYLTAERKVYRAGVTFGIETDSQDATGRTIRETDASHLDKDSIERALAGFRGVIEQVPPMVSAIHHEGKRLYQLARKGLEVERKPRTVEIYGLDLTGFEAGAQAGATLEVECSTGTYIRTLAADIGAAVGTGAMLQSLRRTRVGSFTLSEAATLEELEERKQRDELSESVRSIREALSMWPSVTLDQEALNRIRQGQPVEAHTSNLGLHLLLDGAGAVAAVAELRADGLFAPIKVLTESA